MSRAQRAAAALNEIHNFSVEDHAGLHEVALDYFTAETSFRESDTEGETDSDQESASSSEERETSKHNSPTGTNTYKRHLQQTQS